MLMISANNYNSPMSLINKNEKLHILLQILYTLQLNLEIIFKLGWPLLYKLPVSICLTDYKRRRPGYRFYMH